MMTASFRTGKHEIMQRGEFRRKQNQFTAGKEARFTGWHPH